MSAHPHRLCLGRVIDIRVSRARLQRKNYSWEGLRGVSCERLLLLRLREMLLNVIHLHTLGLRLSLLVHSPQVPLVLLLCACLCIVFAPLLMTWLYGLNLQWLCARKCILTEPLFWLSLRDKLGICDKSPLLLCVRVRLMLRKTWRLCLRLLWLRLWLCARLCVLFETWGWLRWRDSRLRLRVPCAPLSLVCEPLLRLSLRERLRLNLLWLRALPFLL